MQRSASHLGIATSQKYSNKIIIHSLLSLLRSVCFLTMKILIFKNANQHKENKAKIINNSIYALQLTFFQLYFINDSIITENHFGYILSAFFMVHNCILIFILLYLVDFNITKSIIFVSSVALIFYILEIGFATLNIIKARAARCFDIFKKIGPNPKKNEAYKIRTIVRTLNLIDMYLVILVSGRFFFPPIHPYVEIDFSILIIFFITLIQHAFIRTHPDIEDKTQRKIAIAMSIFKIGALIGEIVFISLVQVPSVHFSKTIKFALFSDILLTTISLTYFLYKDLLNYGCGLKEHFGNKVRQVSLNN